MVLCEDIAMKNKKNNTYLLGWEERTIDGEFWFPSKVSLRFGEVNSNVAGYL